MRGRRFPIYVEMRLEADPVKTTAYRAGRTRRMALGRARPELLQQTVHVGMEVRVPSHLEGLAVGQLTGDSGTSSGLGISAPSTTKGTTGTDRASADSTSIRTKSSS